jgi:hypothetical protein
MPPGKPRLKTAVMTLRVEPRIKLAAEKAAEHDRRSLTSLIEILVLRHCSEIGLNAESIDKRETANEKKKAGRS